MRCAHARQTLWDEEGKAAVLDLIQKRTMDAFTSHGRAIEDLATLLQSADDFLELCCRDLDDLMFLDDAAELFELVISLHVSKVYDIISNFCNLNAAHWDAGDTIALGAWLTKYWTISMP